MLFLLIDFIFIMKLAFCYLIFLLTVFSYAQKITVLDSLSHKSIEDVYVVLNDSIVLTTNDLGVISLNKYKNISKLKFIHLNYHTKEYKINNLNDTVFLKQKENTLENIVIEGNKRKKRKQKKITYVHPIKGFLPYGSGEVRPLQNYIHAVYIPAKYIDSSLKIKNIVFKRTLKKSKTWPPFTVLLMTVDSTTNLPYQIIYKDSVFPDNKEQYKTLKVPVLHNIKTPKNGLYVVVDIYKKEYYLKNDLYNNTIPFFKVARLKKHSGFRQFYIDKRRLKPAWIEPLYSQEGIQTFDFGIELIED